MAKGPLPKGLTGFKPLRFGAQVATNAGIPAMAGVYRLICVPLSHVYVGQAYDLSVRCLEHQQQLRDGLHGNHRLARAYTYYGPRAFLFEVLEVWSGRYRPDCLSPMEQRWMDLHGRDRLFNIRPAGSDAWLSTQDSLGGKASTSRGKSSTSEAGSSTGPAGTTRPLGRGRKRGIQRDRDWRNQMPGKDGHD